MPAAEELALVFGQQGALENKLRDLWEPQQWSTSPPHLPAPEKLSSGVLAGDRGKLTKCFSALPSPVE